MVHNIFLPFVCMSVAKLSGLALPLVGRVTAQQSRGDFLRLEKPLPVATLRPSPQEGGQGRHRLLQFGRPQRGINSVNISLDTAR